MALSKTCKQATKTKVVERNRINISSFNEKQQETINQAMMTRPTRKINFNAIIIYISLAAAIALHGIGVNAKQLVVFAGPHKTSETSVEQFFLKHAQGDHPETEKEKSLKGWSWPRIFDLGSPHLAFDRLVIEFEKSDVKGKIMDALVDYLADSSEGLIVGGDEFDRMGDTVFSQRDAAAAIDAMADAIGIEKKDVTVVLLYEHPRVKQWLSIYTHEIAESSSNSAGFEDLYHEFLCDPETAAKRLESLDTAMNPLGLATKFTDAGYNVAMIDLSGVRGAELMIEDVIGCEVLGGSCTDGFLDGFGSTKAIDYFYLQEDEPEHPFHMLTTEDVKDLEQLFRLRDCNYRDITDNKNFKLLYESNIFMSCPKGLQGPLSHTKALRDTSVLFNAIQSQRNCNTENVSIQKMIKLAPEVNVINIQDYTDEASVAAATAAAATTNDGESEAVVGSGADAGTPVKVSSSDTAGDDLLVEVGATNDDVEGSGADAGTTVKVGSSDTAGDDLSVQVGDAIVEDESEGLHPAWVVQIIIATGVVFWMAFMLRAKWLRKREDGAVRYAGPDGIMPRVFEGRERPISLIM